MRMSELGYSDVERHAFADKVREVTQLITGHKMGLTHEAGDPFYNSVYNYTQEDKNYYLESFGYTVGESLQIIGTDAIRERFNYNTWVISLFETVGRDCFANGNILIIPDVRFPNEADYIIKNGGMVVRLEGDPMDIRKNTTRDINHISETALDDYQNFTTIINNEVADIEVFNKKILDFSKKYLNLFVE